MALDKNNFLVVLREMINDNFLYLQTTMKNQNEKLVSELLKQDMLLE